MNAPPKIRFVVFTSEEGHKVAVNPDHVLIVEPRPTGAVLFFGSPAAGAPEGLTRRVVEPFDEVMRSLRDEARPRLPRE